MKHFYCDFRVQHLNLRKNWHISFLLAAKSEILYISVIISEGTPIYRNGDAEYCLVPEEWNPVRKNPKQILVFSKFGGPLALWDPQGYCLHLWCYGWSKTLLHFTSLCVSVVESNTLMHRYCVNAVWSLLLKHVAESSVYYNGYKEIELC